MAIDKLILKTQQEIQFSSLRERGFTVKPVRSGSSFCTIHEVRSPVSLPGSRHLAEHKIIVYRFKDFSKIQLNPNYFSAFKSVELLVGLMVRDISEPQILQTDFDVTFRRLKFDDLKVSIDFRNSRSFQRVTRYDNRSSSKNPSTTIEFENRKYANTFYLGSRKGDQLVFYERIKLLSLWPNKDERLREESIRVEMRFRKLKRIRFSEARLYWATLNPFERVTFHEYNSLDSVKAQHRSEIELFREKSEDTSPKEAEDWFKRNVTGTNHARFKRRLNKSRRKVVGKHRLDERFTKDLERFLKAKPSPDEELWLR